MTTSPATSDPAGGGATSDAVMIEIGLGALGLAGSVVGLGLYFVS